MPYKDKVKQRAFQNRWLKYRRDTWIYENGPCKLCGSRENLEIDHIDPKQKKIRITDLWSKQESTSLVELAKCQVLCKSCHLKKTKIDLKGITRINITQRSLSPIKVVEFLTEVFIHKTGKRKAANMMGITWGVASNILYKGYYKEYVRDFETLTGMVVAGARVKRASSGL